MAAAVQNPPARTDWAEDSEPDLATTLPPPQITKNKDGTETVVTIFINEDGKRVKRTQRIRRTVVKKKENPRVAERRQWAKIGPEAGKPAGPRPDTTTLGENIIFRPVVGFKSGQQQEKAPEEDKKAEALKKMQIKCRICSGDHFTTKCPFKDTMAPEGEAAGPPPDLDERMGGNPEGALGGGGSSYVPPHLRNKGAGGAGEKMGGRYGERDDLATLRVTNVSLLVALRFLNTLLTSTRSQSSRKKLTCGICSSGSAASLVSSLRRTERLGERRALRSCHMQIDRMQRGRVKRWMAMGSVT
jgi:translation initiation factor 3 subunit G